MPLDTGMLEGKAARFSGVPAAVAFGGGLLSAVLGLTVLLGWHTHNITLIQVFPAFVPMQYNTALGFILCGLALLLALQRRPGLAALPGAIAVVLGPTAWRRGR